MLVALGHPSAIEMGDEQTPFLRCTTSAGNADTKATSLPHFKLVSSAPKVSPSSAEASSSLDICPSSSVTVLSLDTIDIVCLRPEIQRVSFGQLKAASDHLGLRWFWFACFLVLQSSSTRPLWLLQRPNLPKLS